MTADAAEQSYPVPPDCVYVWRGFRAPNLTQDQFASFLGSIFVPACALLQPDVGLRAYVSCLVSQAGKPAAVPDQTALMFWADPGAHDLATRSLAVRIYQNLHGGAYDMARSHTTEVPVALPPTGGTLTADQPYHILDDAADWMIGATHHVIGCRSESTDVETFLATLHSWASELRARPPTGVDGALIAAGNDFAAAWVHGHDPDVDLSAALAGFTAAVEPFLAVAPIRKPVSTTLWDDWPGLDLIAEPCLNFQFDRPSDTRPRAGS
jgi:hypothetical protein